MSVEPEQQPSVSEPRWPRVLGTVGIIVGVLIFVDKLDDLVVLPLMNDASWWSGMLGSELGARVPDLMPPTAWIVASSLIGLTLGALLFVGSLRLRNSRRSGVSLTTTWAWLAIVWLAVEIGQASLWLARHQSDIDALAGTAWQGSATLGIVLVFAALATYPVFLLIWFARQPIRSTVAGWEE